MNLNDDLHGYLQSFKHKVVTAEVKKAQIMGVKSCLIQIGNWKCIIEVLVAESSIKTCILGMDVLSVCPPINASINN
jgi:hypothetical protein